MSFEHFALRPEFFPYFPVRQGKSVGADGASFGVANRDAENCAVLCLHDRRYAVALPADRDLDRACPPVQLRHLFDTPHDIDMRQGPSAILTALHRADMPAIKADEQDGTGDRASRRSKLDTRIP